MRALVYHGPKNVSVDQVPDARIERPTDALVRITTTNICGSDLHMYEGRTDVEEGKVLGHENMGEVIAVGDGVDRVRVGAGSCCRSTSAAGSARTASPG
jgi:glutathione-independent formaldehyde dehydrogenase